MQAREPVLASFLHQNIISHASLGKAMAVLLANKLSSRTLLGTQLMQLINDAYRDDPVRAVLPCGHFCSLTGLLLRSSNLLAISQL
jgi:hypothetical protein